MADFVIRPAGDPDWGNARFLSGRPAAGGGRCRERLGLVAGCGLRDRARRVADDIPGHADGHGTHCSSAPSPASSRCGMRATCPTGLSRHCPILPGPFDLTAVAAPTASGGVITFDGVDDVLIGARWTTPARIIPGARHVRDYTLPDASGGDAGQGFSIAGFAYDDADGTWWAVNGGLNYDGSSADRQQSLVHLSADFSNQPGRDRPRRGAARPRHQRRKPAGRRGRQCERLSLGRVADCAGDPLFRQGHRRARPGQRHHAGYDIGSLAIAERWGCDLGHVPPPGDATIQKISTDGTAP
jgi:hypothetical protein